MRKRRGRKRLIRWLPDRSWTINQTGQRLANNTTPPYVALGHDDLLKDTGGMPNQFLSAGVTGWANSFEREAPQSLIIDHIQGKVFWGFEGFGGDEGDQDASGTWNHIVRMAIWIAAADPAADGSAVNAVDLGGVPASTAAILNPGSTSCPMTMGSFAPDGVRVLWRRTWMVINAWNADEADAWFGSENMCPPGPYVDIKPHRILRPNELLRFGWFINAVPTPGQTQTGTMRSWVGSDLRVAAHNTSRRR